MGVLRNKWLGWSPPTGSGFHPSPLSFLLLTDQCFWVCLEQLATLLDSSTTPFPQCSVGNSILYLRDESWNKWSLAALTWAQWPIASGPGGFFTFPRSLCTAPLHRKEGDGRKRVFLCSGQKSVLRNLTIGVFLTAYWLPWFCRLSTAPAHLCCGKASSSNS